MEGKLSFLVSSVCWEQEQVGEVIGGIFWLMKVGEVFGETWPLEFNVKMLTFSFSQGLELVSQEQGLRCVENGVVGQGLTLCPHIPVCA